MATSVLSPLTAAIAQRFRGDATLMALVGSGVGGGVHDGVPQGVAFPFIQIDVREKDNRGFGTGTLPETDIRIHVFSRYVGMKEAQRIIDRVVVLLKDQPLSVDGFNHCGDAMFHDSTVPFANVEVNGEVVRELVGMFRGYFEKAA